jgi:hypothetical protein
LTAEFGVRSEHSKAQRAISQPAMMTLAAACRRVGISVATAVKLLEGPEGGFPPAFCIGGRRYVSPRLPEAWLAAKTGKQMSSAA